MKKRYFISASVSLVLLLVAFCLFLGQYLLNGCLWWECAPQRDFHVLDWEIPANLFPKGAIVSDISTPSEGHGEIEGGGQDINIGDGIAVYEIYRFPSAGRAISDFNRMKKSMFDPETGIEWKTPADVTFSSPTADDLYIACGYFYQYRCELAARYQEYAIFFGATINDKMTYAEFEKVLFYLDEQISSHLYE